MRTRERPTEGAWLIDLRHYLDEKGRLRPDIPEQALSIALFAGSIVAWETSGPYESAPKVTNVHCRRRPRRKRCTGEIVAAVDGSRSAIDWLCPICGYHGSIQGWEGSAWDRTAVDA